MVQAKINRELAGYITYSKSKNSSMVQETGRNSVLLLKEPGHNNNDDALAGEAATLSLLSPPTDNSNSQHINKSHMKCYYDHTHCHFLDYTTNPFWMMQ